MKAFTLIETLVAITIVLLAVMGPFQLVQQSLSASYVARDQVVATALAEEGLEYVRAIRDNNYLYNLANPTTPRYWLYSLDSTAGEGADCFATRGCTVDPTRHATPQAIAACTSACPPLYIHSTTNVYTQLASGAAQSRFRRTVLLEEVQGSSDKVVKVSVTVSYASGHRTRTVTVSDYLYNWL
ncbi:MAG: hypothetical protein AAB582_00795 [Patescibacteria group bacterium]